MGNELYNSCNSSKDECPVESCEMKSYCNSSLGNNINYGGVKGTSYINTSNRDYSYYGSSLPNSYF